MIRRPPRSTLSSSSAASDVYKRQVDTVDIADIVDTVDILDTADIVDTADILDTAYILDTVDIVDTVDTLDTVHTVDYSQYGTSQHGRCPCGTWNMEDANVAPLNKPDDAFADKNIIIIKSKSTGVACSGAKIHQNGN